MAIGRLLSRHRKLGIDTSVFIYQVQHHALYAPLANRIFTWIEQDGSAVTSTIAMLELLVKPYETGDIDLVNRFYALLSKYPRLEWRELTLGIADRAADLRARYGLRTPDAVQLATALESGATGFLSNDHGFRKVTELEVALLDDLR